MLRAWTNITRGMSGLSISGCNNITRLSPSLVASVQPPTSIISQRCMSGFFNHGDAEGLWKSMAGVSAQGKKRGRSRNTMQKKNLNLGKRLGWGKAKMHWPGLTTSPISGAGKDSKKKKPEVMPEKIYESYQEELAEAAKKNTYSGRRNVVDPLSRGWTGGKAPGRKFGAPQAANQELEFENFDSILLEFKTVFHMTGNLGRVRRNSILMVTGNGNGAVGFTLSPGKYGGNMAGYKKAVNKAGLRLMYVERYEERTVYHDFFTQFGNTRIFVKQQPPGSGVQAHRAIRAICQMVGIKDLYAKVEGSTSNYQHVTKAFMLGLLRQKTHQVLADEKKLHLVEMRAENDYFPRVVASPTDGIVRTKDEIGHNEILDYEMICFEGNLPLWRERVDDTWVGTPGWDKYLRKGWARQHHASVRTRMRVEHGDEWGSVRSHLYPKYPECVERDWKKYIKMWKERKGTDDD